jgi:hypothetical protein
MENILIEKPKGALKKWAVAGIITSLLFLVSYVLIDMYYYQMMTVLYQTELSGLDYASIFISVNGLFGVAALLFFIGIFAAKKRRFFIQFMLWTMLLVDLYFAMPSIGSLVQIFGSYTGLQMMYYVGLLLPQTLIAVLLVSFILQKDSEHKKITRVLGWVSIIAGAVLFVFQIIYAAMQAGSMDFLGNVYDFSGAIALALIICLSVVILLASKKPSEAAVAEEDGKARGEDEQLDEVVEKIAQQVCKGDDLSAQSGEPDED